jgi:hypothetical protein
MKRNMESGVRQTLIAKLREGGKTEQEATALADKHNAAGVQYVYERASLYTASDGDSAYDKAFADLSEWANSLA